jgi:competence protein ComEC
MRISILSFALGVALVQSREVLPGWSLWFLLGTGFVAVRLIIRSQKKLAAACRRMVLALACLSLGIAWASWRADARLAEELPLALEGRDVEVEGIIASLPAVTDRGTRFELDVEKMMPPEAMIPSHLSVTWYVEAARKSGAVTPVPDFRPGQRWHLTLRLKRPHGTVNPHGFDFEAWALERNIRATGYVRPNGNNERAGDDARGLSYRIDEMRAVIRDRFNAVLKDEPYRGVLIGLAIGEQNAIPREQWKTFWRTGVGHLVSISGLHITMVASLIYALTFFVWARIPAFTLRLPAQKTAALAGMFAALVYSLIAGFSVPAQRTFFMVAVVALALWSGRITSPSRVLCWALFAVLLIDPWAVLAPGFWLSFGAVAMIFYVTTGRTGQLSVLRDAALTQLAVTLGLLPMLLALFQEVSVISPIANAFAIPLVSLVIVPVTLIAAVVPVDALMYLAHWLMALCMIPLDWLAKLPAAVWESHAPLPWTVALALLGCAWLLLPRGFPARWLGFIWMLPMFLVLPPRPEPGEVWVTALDVGQGLAVALQTSRHALVYDAGPAWNPDADSGNRIIVPYLRGEGMRRLDGLIVSHEDDDHSGGAISILDARSPLWLLSSLPEDSEILGHTAQSRRCEAGQSWDWDGVRFSILHPTRDSYAIENIRTNDRGCVLKVESTGGSVLIAADIEMRSEAELLRRDRTNLRSDVLLVPHHGSKTSSTAEFIAAVAPKIAIFTVGYRNRFRHPHPDVVARYIDFGSRMLRSDESGAITLKFLRTGWVVEMQREKGKRYWHDVPRVNGSSD